MDSLLADVGGWWLLTSVWDGLEGRDNTPNRDRIEEFVRNRRRREGHLSRFITCFEIHQSTGKKIHQSTGRGFRCPIALKLGTRLYGRN